MGAGYRARIIPCEGLLTITGFVGSVADQDDQEVGKFWQARYQAVRLLDETAILACAVPARRDGLNPIRAAIAQTLERSDYTSVQ